MMGLVKALLSGPNHITFADVLLIVGGAWLLYILWRFHKAKDNFDLSDLVIGPEGKVSLFKFAQLGSFLISTWGFVHLTWNNHLSEWYYTTYMFAWAGAAIANKWLVDRSTHIQRGGRPVARKKSRRSR